MIEEARRIITTIKQMEASLDDAKTRNDHDADDEGLKITFPLTRCLQGLKDKHLQISKLHRERFEQVKSKEICAQSVEESYANISQSSSKHSNLTHLISNHPSSRSPYPRPHPMRVFLLPSTSPPRT
jgi:hypothetical protein